MTKGKQRMEAAASNTAIVSTYIGEHVPYGVVRGICRWMTWCLKTGVRPATFRRRWNAFCDSGGDEDVPPGLVQDEEEPWLDFLEEAELGTLYAVAFKRQATGYVGYNNNGYIDIVAIRGTPSATQVASVVLQEHSVPEMEDEALIIQPEGGEPDALAE